MQYDSETCLGRCVWMEAKVAEDVNVQADKDLPISTFTSPCLSIHLEPYM